MLYIGLFFNGVLILQLLGSQEGAEILACFPAFSLLVGLGIIIRTLIDLPKNLSFSPSKYQWLNKLKRKTLYQKCAVLLLGNSYIACICTHYLNPDALWR